MPREFIGEDAGSAERKRVHKRKRSMQPAVNEQAAVPPRATSKARKAASNTPAFMRLLRDVKTGLLQLGRLTKRLTDKRPTKLDYKAQRRAAARPPLPTRTATPKSEQQDIAKIIERELRTLSETAPPKVRVQLIREYQARADEVVRMQLPQTYASMIHAEKVTPAQVALRPKQSKAVTALMQATQAIRKGRLPFLPRQTRVRAQQLLNQIFGEKRAAQLAKSARVPRIIERQRLIPTIVRNVVEAAARKAQQEPPRLARLLHKAAALPLSTARRYIESAPIPSSKGPTPIAPHDLPRLARTVPSFATQGVASGGSYIAEADEDVHVITRNDSPLATPSESTRTPTAPAAASSRKPAAAGAFGGTAGGPRTAGAPAGVAAGPARTTSAQKIEGTLRIDGLADWIAKVEGRMKDV